MKLQRPIETYQSCNPQAMAHEMSDEAKHYAFADMRADLLALHAENLTLKRLLCEAAYPRRGTPEEHQTMIQFAEKVQQIITHAEAVELS